jgi:glutamate-1-semialdehyde 2,1-aminomutase
MWDDALEVYLRKTKRSKELFEAAKRVFVGGVNHNIRFFEPYPFFAEKASGAFLWDVDGNRYLDFWMGHGSLILGHSPEVVTAKLREQVINGTIFGTVNEVSVKLGELICDCVPCAELVRFCNSGAEATMYGVRLARAYTKKRVVIKIEGGWHGYNSDLIKDVSSPFGVESAGVEDNVKYVTSVPFNDLEAAKRKIDEKKSDLACVLVEPVLGGGVIPAEREYLKGLREETEKAGCLLFFDEVITGFRIALGGGQEYYGIIPDLAALGKVLGGGLPIGAVCGLKEIMAYADPKLPKNERAWIGGGTFSANPLSMTAGLSTLQNLIANNGVIYPYLNELGEEARRGIDKAFAEVGIHSATTGLGSLLLTHFPKDCEALKDARAVYNCDRRLQFQFYFALLAKHNIFFLPGHLGAISYAHTKQHIKMLIDSVVELAQEAKSVSNR